jgi:hypothetical protein
MRLCKIHGKRMHPTQASAIRGALAASKKRGTPLRTYYDRECKSWHLTKLPKNAPLDGAA